MNLRMASWAKKGSTCTGDVVAAVVVLVVDLMATPTTVVWFLVAVPGLTVCVYTPPFALMKCDAFIVSDTYPRSVSDTAMVFSSIASWDFCIFVKLGRELVVNILGISSVA